MAGVGTGVPAAVLSRKQQRGQRMFSASDDTVMMKQIQATHNPDGRIVIIKPILSLVEGIFQHAAPIIEAVMNGKTGEMHTREEKVNLAALEDAMIETLAYVIQKISCEISCKCSGGGDAHGTTMAIFNMLSAYPWDAKVVLALAALALSYGEFTIVVQLQSTNQLAKSVVLLKQLPDMLEHSSSLKPQFTALNTLMKALIDVTNCIIMFSELPPQYISAEVPPLSVAITHIPTAAYWIIRGVVVCASQIASLIGLGHEFIPSTTEAWELSSLAYKVSSIHDHLQKQLAICEQHIDEKKHFEAYQTLVRLFDKSYLDNMTIIKHIIYLKDDIQPLEIGSTKEKATLEVLRKKTVLLLISDLDITHEDIGLLDLIYRDSRARADIQFEIVWLPIVDVNPKSPAWDAMHEQKFEGLRSFMPWYIVHPSIIEPAVVKYIKEVWHFSKRIIIVAIDPQGRLASSNALHMIRIWGSLAFPFTKEREEALWKSESWRLELIIDDIDENIISWIQQQKYICLFGGEDMEWIKKFTKAARDAAKNASITLEMAYVGKSKAKERIVRNATTITTEKLSYCWTNQTLFWYFWVRLESMLYSKLQHGKTTENDAVMQEIMTILSYDGSDQGWAIFCHGLHPGMARAKADNAIGALVDIEHRLSDVEKIGFINTIADIIRKKEQETPHHCSRLILPGFDGGIPERVVCAECGREMEKFIMYRCCTE